MAWPVSNFLRAWDNRWFQGNPENEASGVGKERRGSIMKKVLLTIIIFAMLGIGVLFTILPVWMLLLSWTLISVLAELAIFASSTKMIRSK